MIAVILINLILSGAALAGLALVMSRVRGLEVERQQVSGAVLKQEPSQSLQRAA